MRRLRRPSPATVIAVISLVVALSTSAYAAVVITGKNIKDGSLTGADIQNGSLGSRDVHNGTLSGDDVAPDSLTGAQIDESTLGRIAHAKLADRAGSADSAAQLDAGAGNRVFSVSQNSDRTLVTGGAFTTVLSLDVPAGRYLITADGTVTTDAAIQERGIVLCSVRPGSAIGDRDDIFFDVGPSDPSLRVMPSDAQVYARTFVHDFSAPGTIRLLCAPVDVNGGVTARAGELSALQVGEASATKF